MSAHTPGKPGEHITEQGDNHGSEERGEAHDTCCEAREISKSGEVRDEAGCCKSPGHSSCIQEEGSSHQCGEGCPCCGSRQCLMRGEEGGQEEVVVGLPEEGDLIWWMIAGIYIAFANVQGIALVLFLYAGATAGWSVIPVAPILVLFLIWLWTSGWMIVKLTWRLR